ncbi:MAG: Mut7-C RNAse domain-containing protein [Planctomycetota bacterium]|nr:Mut7-C RNAse domain-containing protein [Planctomycetota bacterium]
MGNYDEVVTGRSHGISVFRSRGIPVYHTLVMPDPVFLCDAMLGGLARWLRAAGYDAEFEYGIDDGELIARAAGGGRMILSSDGPLFERNVIKKGRPRALYVPQQLSKFEQLAFVMRRLKLPLRRPRCMACGGELLDTPKHKVADEAPPLVYRRCDRFWRCSRCEKLLWHGTHWQKITKQLAKLTHEDKTRDVDWLIG